MHMEHDPDSKARTLAQLAPLLASALNAVAEEQRDAVIRNLSCVLDRQDGRPLERRVDIALNEHDTYYIVHDTDLQLLKGLAGVAVSFMPFFFKPLGALPALVALLYRYRRMSAPINVEQAAVLISLRKVSGGYTLSELRSSLDLQTPPSTEKLAEILNSLKNVVLANGTITSFVAQSGDVWFASDV